MRLRLGLLRDTASIERQAAREAAQSEAKKHKPSVPTVKTEAQTKAEQESTAKAKEKAIEEAKSKPLPRIRPLSESKAIDSGANFISEAFLFAVAGGLIVFESWRSRRKESSRQEDVKGRLRELEQSEKNAREALVTLEKEVLELRGQMSKKPLPKTERLLPREIWEVEQKEQQEKPKDERLFSKLTGWITSFGKQEEKVETEEPKSTPTQPQPLPKSTEPLSPAATTS
jgi:hypothetical protein